MEQAKEDEMKASDRDHSDESTSDSDNGDETIDTSKVEWLATTREKRSTAGNRMKSMLAHEEPDSDVDLLFAEDDNDAGFTDVEDGGSDVQMDSSSDDEDDQNAANDMEGEKELEKQAKERRAAMRKRKAQEAIPAKFRKKVRIDQAAVEPRPKKKSERLSWLPSVADLPTRASERKTTRMSKEQLHEQMKEREARRLKQLALQEKKAKKLEAMKKPPMTQAERLAEAANVEKRNSKSLNRWEEAEKQREEERMKKLAALNDRTMKGPFLTFWSGMGHGDYAAIQEKERKKRMTKAEKEQLKALEEAKEKEAAGGPDISETTTPVSASAPGLAAQPSTETHLPDGSAPAKTAPDPIMVPPKAEGETEAKPGAPEQVLPAGGLPPVTGLATSTEGDAATTSTQSLLEQTPVNLEPAPALMAPPAFPPPVPKSSSPSSVLAPPVLVPPPGAEQLQPGGTPALSVPPQKAMANVLAAPVTTHRTSPLSMPAPPSETVAPVVSNAPPSDYKPLQPTRPKAVSIGGSVEAAEPSPLAETPAEDAEAAGASTRNAIILQNFNENAIKDKVVQTQILFGRKMSRVSKNAKMTPQAALCVITNHPAKYRDPATGLPYFNAYAYREIQRLKRGDYKWSRLLGAWVGNGTLAAKGVPPGFLGLPEPKAEVPAKAGESGDAGETMKTEAGAAETTTAQKTEETSEPQQVQAV